MRKTIFGRIFFSNLLTISFCLVALGTLLFTLFNTYIISEKKETLREEVRHISELTVFFQDNPSAITSSFYEISMNEAAHRIGGIAFLINAEGKVLAGSKNAPEHLAGTLSRPVLARLFSGAHSQLGDMGGFFPTTYLFVSEPISYHGEVPAVSCVAVPVPQIHRYRNDMFGTVLLAIFVTTLLTAIVSFFVSRRISRPLKSISTAAKSITKGDFSVQLPVRGNDEIAAVCETFNQMTYSLNKLEEMRNGFIASVSHELRTPMTTISGFIEGILDGTIAPDSQEKYLSIVLGETKRLSRLVNELLLVARMEDGLSLHPSTFDMNEAVRIAALRFEALLTEKGLEADISFAEETCMVFADRDAIDRVLTNLFDNAIKFNRPGGYVKVSVKRGEGAVLVSVENAGEGISPDELPMIWDKFYKTDRSRSLDKTGVGLGLYLVKNIIALHSGRITAESEAGAYTRFTFTLPKK